MEEKELNQKLHEMFKEMSMVLEDTKQGFLTQDQATLKKSDTKLTGILTSNLPFTEELVQKQTKDEIEKKYLNLLPHLQLMAVIIRNLISENKKKIESDLLFADKAINEIKGLYTLMLTQFEDTTDYILTRNPHLRTHIKTGMENLFERAEDCMAELETRMITCACMPKASYSYVAIIDSIKGLSRELNNFSEKL
jgi:Na+/phosphate symporter